jgi:hypothetical protein
VTTLGFNEINRPVRPGSLRTGTDGLPPSVLGPDGDGAVFLNEDGDGRQRRPGTGKSPSPAVIHRPRPTTGGYKIYLDEIENSSESAL